jgi:hypothetical protein
MSQQGTSLIELTLGAALMGLLFFSGLQLLSSFFSVQSHLVGSESKLSVEPLLLDVQLQQQLQETMLVELDSSQQVLSFEEAGQSKQLRFQQDSQTWSLWKDARQWAHWSKAAVQNKPHFDLLASNRLAIYLPNEKAPLLVWLRNRR